MFMTSTTETYLLGDCPNNWYTPVTEPRRIRFIRGSMSTLYKKTEGVMSTYTKMSRGCPRGKEVQMQSLIGWLQLGGTYCCCCLVELRH